MVSQDFIRERRNSGLNPCALSRTEIETPRDLLLTNAETNAKLPLIYASKVKCKFESMI